MKGEAMGQIELDIRPIGWVRNEVKELTQEGWGQVVSLIEIEPDWEECLDGVEEFSHLVVLFWLHKLPPEERSLKKVHPQGRQDLPLMGAFATRSRRRPNPIGTTTVRLLGREGRVLRVQGLDALDGTPILDLKPYSRGLDEAEKVRVPEWLERSAWRRGWKD